MFHVEPYIISKCAVKLCAPSGDWLQQLLKHLRVSWFCWISVCAERHDALYVVGALEEAMELRGMRYHPIDIETSVIRTHKSITEW